MTPTALRAWRKHLGLSQSAAAEAIGKSRAMFQRYEKGLDPVPLTLELACAALALGITRYAGPDSATPAPMPATPSAMR